MLTLLFPASDLAFSLISRVIPADNYEYMITYNLEELKTIAKGIYSRYPKALKVAITSDGMAFITDEGDIAVKSHAANNVYRKELKIFSFDREEFEKVEELLPGRAEDVIVLIHSATTAEEVESIKEKETAGRNRKTVIAAATDKLNSFKKE